MSVEVLITHHGIPETIFAHGRPKPITSLSFVSGRVQESPPGRRTGLPGRKEIGVFLTWYERKRFLGPTSDF